MERFYPGTIIIAVFGRTRTYDDPAGWFDTLREARSLMRPFSPLLFSEEFGIITKATSGSGYIVMELEPDKALEEAEAIAAKIYAMIAPKAEMVGIEDVPVVFVQRWLGRAMTADFKDPRHYLGTPLPLDQGFRPVPGGAQRKAGGRLATIGFPVGDPSPFGWDNKDILTTGHIGDTIAPVDTRVYQPLHAHLVGTIADVASYGGRADVARVAIADGDVIPYVRTMTFWTAPVTGWRDPAMHEWSGKFGRTSGRTSGRIRNVDVDLRSPMFGVLKYQATAYVRIELGDSGSPLFISGPAGGVAVTGIAWGWFTERPWIGVFSPVSGVMHELPGWYPYTR